MTKTRRSNNTGSIYNLPERKRPFVAQISDHGRRITQSFETREEAEAWLNKTLISDTKEHEDLTLIVYLQNWLELRNPERRELTGSNLTKSIARLRGITLLAPTTYLLYKRTIENHILPALQNRKRLKVSEIKISDIEAVLASRMDKGVGDRTVQVIRRILSKALRDAVKLGLRTTGNVATELSTPYRSPERKPPSEEEFQKLVKAAQGTRYENLIPIVGVTGLRRGEALGLKWSDIDWQKSVIRIEHQAQRLPITGKEVKQKENKLGIGSANIFRELKTDSSRREIYLGKRAIQLLVMQKALLEKERRRAQNWKRGWKEMDLVFPSSIGTIMEPTVLSRNFKKLLKVAGLREDITFHDLRHFSVTMLASKKVGANAKSIGKRTGQKDPGVILLYTHTIEAEDQEIAEMLEETLLPKFDVPETQVDQAPGVNLDNESDPGALQQNLQPDGGE